MFKTKNKKPKKDYSGAEQGDQGPTTRKRFVTHIACSGSVSLGTRTNTFRMGCRCFDTWYWNWTGYCVFGNFVCFCGDAS